MYKNKTFDPNESTLSNRPNLALKNYSHNWPLFVAGVVLCLTLAFLYQRYKAIPLYNINSTILLKENEEGTSSTGLESFSDLNTFKTPGKIENEVGMLKSESLTYSVLNDMSREIMY